MTSLPSSILPRALALALGTVALPASAVDWLFDANIGARATVSDNGNQSSDNAQTETRLSVIPTVNARTRGSQRLDASVTYGLDATTRLDDGGNTANGNKDSITHLLGAYANAELVEDLFYLDARANVSPQLLSLLSAPTADRGDTGNRATVGTYSVSPSLVKRFGNFSTGTVRYTAGGALFSDNAANNAQINTLTGSLVNGSRFGNFNWGVDYSLRKANNDNQSDSTFERYSATLGYALTRQVRVFATVGRDDNDFQSSTGQSGGFYSAGLNWTPNQRSNLELAAGERFFGKTLSATGNFRTRTTTWSMRYSEDVSDLSRQLGNLTLARYWECPAGSGNYEASEDQPSPDCSAQSLTQAEALQNGGVLDNAAGLARGVFILRSFSGNVGWTISPRLSTAFTLTENRREYLTGAGQDDRTRSVFVSARRVINPLTELRASLGFTQNDVPASVSGLLTDRSDDLLSASLSLSHSFRRDLAGTLAYRHIQRQSNAGSANYDENSLTASINLQF